MKHLAPVLALVLLAACNPPPPTDVAQSGTPRVPTTQLSVDWPPIVPLTVAPAVTTAEVTTTTAAPTAEVVPMTAAPAVRSGSCGGWRDLIASYFPANQVGNACSVMLCESEGNPNAVSPTNDHGLFQINAVHRGSFDWSRRYDPGVNAAFAASLWRQRGWGPWTCQP